MVKLTRRHFQISLGNILGVTFAGCVSVNSPSSVDNITRGNIRSQNDVLNITKEVNESDVEYLEGKDRVRYPSYKKTNGEIVYKTLDFEKWASSRCATLAAAKVAELVQENVGKTPTIAVSTAGNEVVVTRRTLLDRDGDVLKTPTVSEIKLKEITPSEINVSVVLEGQEHSCKISIIYEEDTSRRL